MTFGIEFKAHSIRGNPYPAPLSGQEPVTRHITGLQEESTTTILPSRHCLKHSPDDLLDPWISVPFHPHQRSFYLQ